MYKILVDYFLSISLYPFSPVLYGSKYFLVEEKIWQEKMFCSIELSLFVNSCSCHNIMIVYTYTAKSICKKLIYITLWSMQGSVVPM